MTQLSDWRRVDGVMLPMRIRQRLDDKWLVSDLTSRCAAGERGRRGSRRPTSVAAASVRSSRRSRSASRSSRPGVGSGPGSRITGVVSQMRDHWLLARRRRTTRVPIAVMQRARTLGNASRCAPYHDPPSLRLLRRRAGGDRRGAHRDHACQDAAVLPDPCQPPRHYVVDYTLARAPRRLAWTGSRAATSVVTQ